MPRRLRARDDLDWTRLGIGTCVGLLLGPGLPIAGYYLALWTREPNWLVVGILGMPVGAIAGIVVAFQSIWSRLIAVVICVPIWFCLHVLFIWSIGCDMQRQLGIEVTACL